MPEPTDEELGIDPGLDPNIRAELRKSRQLSRELAEAQEAVETAKREAAFAKAGIPDTPLGQMFAKAFDGDVTDPAAIKAQFEALNPQAPVTPDPEDLDAQRTIATLGADASTGAGPKYEDLIRSAKSADEVMELVAQAPPTATDAHGHRISIPEIQ